jgi:hypothetical protein
MKVDEVTLQNILNAYGKQLKPDNTRSKPQKQELSNKNKSGPKLVSEDLDIINYDKEGKINNDTQKKEALVDFFQ